MVEEGLLKKSVIKKTGAGGDGGADELVNVAFKCNFDYNFIQEVANKIDFHLSDYLYQVDNEE